MSTPQDLGHDPWAAEAGNGQPSPVSFRAPNENERARNEWNPIPISQLGPSTPPEWVWPGYIAKGHSTLLTALWKAGKTTLMAHLLHNLHAGGGLVGDPTGIKTLVVSEESQTLWCGRRDEFGLTDDVHVVPRPFMAKPTNAAWMAFVQRVAELVRERGYGLVVFDTLASLWPVVQENDASEVGAAMMPLHAIATAGAALVLIHHPRKGAGDTGSQGQASRGSGALPGFVDVIVEMSRHTPEDRHDRRRVLSAWGRFDETPPETVLELTDHGYVVIGDKATVRKADRTEIIASILPTAGDGWTTEETLEKWPSQNKPGKRGLQMDLNAGAAAGGWQRTGTGRKNDPFRYLGSAGFVSRTPPPLGARIESKPLGASRTGRSSGGSECPFPLLPIKPRDGPPDGIS